MSDPSPSRGDGPRAEHTKEPWYVGSQNDALYITSGKPPAQSNDHPDHDAVREVIAKLFGSHPDSDANARRIVACVNACAGMTDKQISHGLVSASVMSSVVNHRGELQAALLQVARMAEALKRDCGMDPESPQAIRNAEYMNISYAARAALARVTASPATDPAAATVDAAIEVITGAPAGPWNFNVGGRAS